MMGDTLINIGNASVGYRYKRGENRLLQDLNIEVKRGELIALIGKNGSGKTTFLKSLIRLQDLLEGTIKIEGRDLSDYRPLELARKAGFVASVPETIPGMTVQELVRTGRYPYTNLFGSLEDPDLEMINKAISICGISDFKNTRLGRMSDGERQKAMLARVFAQDTELIFLDEPTSFLDITNKFEILNLLRKLKKEGRTILFTTHDLNLASRYADKLWLIDNRSITEGAPEDLFLGDKMQKQFGREKLSLDKETGEFIPEFSNGLTVELKADTGCDLAEIWTLKGLRRKGFKVVPAEKGAPDVFARVFIFKEKEKFVWNLQQEEQNLLFANIYQLVSELENLINYELN